MDFRQARINMVESQIRTVKVKDARVLAALRRVPREAFLPERLRAVAYVDDDLRLGRERYMTEPMVLARLLQAAEIGPRDAALAIGCTTGYAVALLAQLAESVVGIECDPAFVADCDRALTRLGVDTAAVVEGDLTLGYPDQAPYDVILIEGRCADIPRGLVDQLAEGGRLVTVTDEDGVGKAILIRRSGAAAGSRILFDAHIPRLAAFDRAPVFRF